MDTKHTPGPWRLEEVVDRGIKHLCPVAEVDGFSLLTVVHTGGYDGDECVPFGAVYRDDDARLIAAAPELLEALRRFANTDLTVPVVRNTFGFDVLHARAAIAKAEGRV